MFDASGAFAGYRGVGKNITERVRSIADLQCLRAATGVMQNISEEKRAKEQIQGYIIAVRNASLAFDCSAPTEPVWWAIISRM